MKLKYVDCSIAVLGSVALTCDAWAQINLLGVDIFIEARRRRRITGALLLF